ncbi:MAG: hypothetical protein C0401_11515 [Anaerolinea sp.]|nr:hypothetical protein [Anaerolinea sp.]
MKNQEGKDKETQVNVTAGKGQESKTKISEKIKQIWIPIYFWISKNIGCLIFLLIGIVFSIVTIDKPGFWFIVFSTLVLLVIFLSSIRYASRENLERAQVTKGIAYGISIYFIATLFLGFIKIDWNPSLRPFSREDALLSISWSSRRTLTSMAYDDMAKNAEKTRTALELTITQSLVTEDIETETPTPNPNGATQQPTDSQNTMVGSPTSSTIMPTNEQITGPYQTTPTTNMSILSICEDMPKDIPGCLFYNNVNPTYSIIRFNPYKSYDPMGSYVSYFPGNMVGKLQFNACLFLDGKTTTDWLRLSPGQANIEGVQWRPDYSTGWVFLSMVSPFDHNSCSEMNLPLLEITQTPTTSPTSEPTHLITITPTITKSQ